MTIESRDLLQHGDFLRALARGLIGDEQLSDDVVQDTFLIALENPPRDRRVLRGWLATVATNFARKVQRSSARRREREHVAAKAEGLPSTDEIAARGELMRRVVEAVFALEEPYRTTIVLRFYEGLSASEIASRSEVPVETVRTRLKRALARLRSQLDEEHHGGRSAWAVPLAGATGLEGVFDAPATVLGESMALSSAGKASASAGFIWGVIMTTKTKVAVTLLVTAGLLSSIFYLGREEGPVLIERDAPLETTGSLAHIESDSATALSEPVPDPTASEPSQLLSSPRQATPRVTGVVVDPAGSPVSEARLISYPDTVDEVVTDSHPNARRAISGEVGRFELELAGEAPYFVVMVEHPRFSPRTVDDVRPGQQRTIALDEPLALVGRVLDLEGQPVPDARLHWQGFASARMLQRETTATADGTFRLERLPDPVQLSNDRITISADEYAPLMLEYRLSSPRTPGGAVDVGDLYLTRGATIEGRVVDGESGEAIEGARVRCWTYSGARLEGPAGQSLDSSLRMPIISDVVSGPDGRFTMPTLPAWGVHHVGTGTLKLGHRQLGYLAAVADGYASASAQIPVLDAGDLLELELRCLPAASVRGQVVDESGEPVVGAEVIAWVPGHSNINLDHPDWPSSRAYTGEHGDYFVENLPSKASETLEVTVKAGLLGEGVSGDAEPVQVAVHPGEVSSAPPLVLKRERWPGVVFTVTDIDGQPIVGAELSEFPGEVARTDERGRGVSYDRQAREQVTVRVAARGFIPERIEVTPSLDPMPEVDVQLKRAQQLTGRVEHRDRSVLPDLVVRAIVVGTEVGELFPGEAGYPSVLSRGGVQADGRFEISGLPPGYCDLVVTDRSSRPLWVQRDVATDARDVILPLPSGIGSDRVEVEVQVTDAETTRPLVRLTSIALLRGSQRLSGQQVAPGLYQMTDVEPGSWKLYVAADGYEAHTQPLDLAVGSSLPRIEVALNPGISIRGWLRTTDGTSCANTKVFLSEVGGSDREEAVTGAQARFEVGGLRPGSRYVVKAVQSSGESSQWLTQALGESLLVPETSSQYEHEIVLEKACILIVEIRCPRLPSWSGNTAEEIATGNASRYEMLDSQGKVVDSRNGLGASKVEGVHPAGVYTLRVEIPGAPPAERTVELDPSSETRLTIEIP